MARAASESQFAHARRARVCARFAARRLGPNFQCQRRAFGALLAAAMRTRQHVPRRHVGQRNARAARTLQTFLRNRGEHLLAQKTLRLVQIQTRDHARTLLGAAGRVERMQLHETLAHALAPLAGRPVHSLVILVGNPTLLLQHLVTSCERQKEKKKKKKKKKRAKICARSNLLFFACVTIIGPTDEEFDTFELCFSFLVFFFFLLRSVLSYLEVLQ